MRRPAYYDPDTGARYDASDGAMEGWMTKQSEWLKDWRRRYFILKGSKLFFSKNEYSAPHGMVDLAQCQTVKSAELRTGKRFAIEVSTRETTFFMYADTEKEKDEWIGTIGKAIVQSSGTIIRDDEVNQSSDEDDD